MKWNKWGLKAPEEPPENDEMDEMILPSWHRIRNSSPGGLRPSTLTLGHGGFPQYWIFTSDRGRNIFVSLTLEGQNGVRTRDRRLSKQAAVTTATGFPPTYSACKISWQFVENWLGNQQKKFTTVNGNPSLTNTRGLYKQNSGCGLKWTPVINYYNLLLYEVEENYARQGVQVFL